MRVPIMGGAGFSGTAVVKTLLSVDEVQVVNVDTLTYAGNNSHRGQRLGLRAVGR